MARRIDVKGVAGVPLAAWEFAPPAGGGGGQGAAAPGGARGAGGAAAGAPAPGVLLLHGLMGRASHWTESARRLAERYRAVGLDQRGHGDSGKPPEGPWTREAYVGDAEAAVLQLGLGPAVVIGHAMGALTAWQLAARRPDLVRGLVIYDMRASALGLASQREWQDWTASWPLPFEDDDAVRRWFGDDDPWVEGPSPVRAAYYAEVMTRAADGLRPVFDLAHMRASREAWCHEAHWEELAQVHCPTLVVRGLDSDLGRAEAQEMVRVLPRGQYAEIPHTGPLVHYGHPDAWSEAIEPFLAGILTG
jgi:pimeloyl-ACP methyl ester carboxylesterase